jgi:hypothetical protein
MPIPVGSKCNRRITSLVSGLNRELRRMYRDDGRIPTRLEIEDDGKYWRIRPVDKNNGEWKELIL